MVYPIIYRVSTIQGGAGFLWISSIHSMDAYGLMMFDDLECSNLWV
jgi:hypothetical protein